MALKILGIPELLWASLWRTVTQKRRFLKLIALPISVLVHRIEHPLRYLHGNRIYNLDDAAELYGRCTPRQPTALISVGRYARLVPANPNREISGFNVRRCYVAHRR